MKRTATFLILFSLGFPCVCAWAQRAGYQGEIVIEMQGEPSEAANAPTLWDRDARALTRKLRGKTREQVLYAVPVVSDKDRIVRGDKGEYALVEYYDGGNFRKFLFKAETPQTFIAAAATPADVLAVNKKYGVNLGLAQDAFEKFYADKAQKETDAALPPNAALYKLSYTDVNTPSPQDRWFLFENASLTLTFDTQKAKDAYVTALREKAQAQTAPKESPRPARQNRTVRKALISGGTEWDKAYLPRVVNPKPALQTPTLTKDPNQK